MRHLVVGTAGHIDHGKSSLVRALTGIDPDRLAEEKERGITIDLGFADLDVGGGRVASFVDVPGHERFVRHMVAGAAGIDAVLLAVAADDGVRPQTREHLAICSLLGVRHGIVALTKTDLVDSDLVEVAVLEVREFLGASFLADAPVVRVSAKSGAGLDSLRDALAGLFDRVPGREAAGLPRLPVDRAFVMKGFGTVVTGTLVAGSLREGDEVEVLPGGRRARIRGLQVHRARVAEARAGQRTAVNLQGLDRDEVPRGSTVTLPGALLSTRRVWGRLRWLPEAGDAARRGGTARFHQGTCERAARVRVIGEAPDGGVDVEILLDGETVLLPGDRFILRRPAPVDTIGGGVVLDIRPPSRRARRAAEPSAFGSDPAGGIRARLSRAGPAGRVRSELAAELGMTGRDLDVLADRLAEAGAVVARSGVLVDAEAWRSAGDGVRGSLAAYHAAEPLRAGMSREELRSQCARAMSQDVWRALLEDLAGGGVLRLAGERVALASHRVVLSDSDLGIARRIEARFRDAGLDPPDAADVLRDEGREKAGRILDLLQEDGRLVRIRDGRWFHAEAIAELIRKLRRFAQTSRRIDVAAFKDLAGVTRKNAIPLLEHLDAERVTRRVGNEREILGA